MAALRWLPRLRRSLEPESGFGVSDRVDFTPPARGRRHPLPSHFGFCVEVLLLEVFGVSDVCELFEVGVSNRLSVSFRLSKGDSTFVFTLFGGLGIIELGVRAVTFSSESVAHKGENNQKKSNNK